jgi:hypothetical protein
MPVSQNIRAVLPGSLAGGYSGSSNRTYTDFVYGAGTYVNFAKPWHRFWQMNAQMGIAGKMHRSHELIRDVPAAPPGDYFAVWEREFTYPELSLDGSAGLHWFPNTRTTCKAGLAFQYSRSYDYQKNNVRYSTVDQESREDLASKNDIRSLSGMFSVSVNYYLSRSVSYYLNGSAGYFDSYANSMYPYNQQATKEWRYACNAGLTWRLF